MIKPDKNYRMSKSAKTKIALMCKNASERSHLKSLLIQSELAEVAARKQALKSKGAKGKDGE
jgi:hypothetical protein